MHSSLRHSIALLAAALGVTAVPAQTNTFPSSGNAGIGTTSPGYKLEVHAASADQALFQSTDGNRAEVMIDNATGGQQSAICLLDAGAGKWSFGKQSDNTFFLYDIVGARTPLYIAPSGSLTLQASGGNVGIGTLSP